MSWHKKILAFMSEIKASGIEPLSYSEQSPYVAFDIQAEIARAEDGRGYGS